MNYLLNHIVRRSSAGQAPLSSLSSRNVLTNLHNLVTFHSSALRGEQFLNADVETFEKAISKQRSAGKIVLVEFYADWCGPCRMLSPILEKLTGTNGTESCDVDLVTVDTDMHGKLAAEHKVTALPTVVAYMDGKSTAGFRGVANESEICKFLDGLRSKSDSKQS